MDTELYKDLSAVEHIEWMFMNMDYIDAFEGAIFAIRRADWKGAWKRRGPLGIVTELLAAITSRNSPTIWVSRMGSWSGIDVERLLRKYGVRIGGRGATPREIYFHVARRQVKWAEYVLLRAGVTVTSVLKEGRNHEWAARHQGAPVPAWRDRKK